jgi:hypothetical protein
MAPLPSARVLRDSLDFPCSIVPEYRFYFITLKRFITFSESPNYLAFKKRKKVVLPWMYSPKKSLLLLNLTEKRLCFLGCTALKKTEGGKYEKADMHRGPLYRCSVVHS